MSSQMFHVFISSENTLTLVDFTFQFFKAIVDHISIFQMTCVFCFRMKISLVLSIAWNALIFVLTPFVLHFYAITDETKQLVLWLVLIHNIFNSIAFPFADSLGKGLRAAGDVKFTTAISITTTVGVRLIFSMLFAILLGWGVIGIALAMCMDWCSRAVVFIMRFRGGKWKKFQLT